MPRYGQFCSIAQALEVVGERWTLLVLREVLMGGERFNDIRRGVPLMSPTLLSKRLRALSDAGVVARIEEGGRPCYRPTQAGRELFPVLEKLGTWGRRWAGTIDDEHLDVSLLMWDLRRSLVMAALPRERTQLFFHFVDAPRNKRSFWIRVADGEVELCINDPGMGSELEVRTTVRVFTEVWMGDRPLHRALHSGEVRVEGAADLVRSLGAWIGLSPFAGAPGPATAALVS